MLDGAAVTVTVDWLEVELVLEVLDAEEELVLEVFEVLEALELELDELVVLDAVTVTLPVPELGALLESPG